MELEGRTMEGWGMDSRHVLDWEQISWNWKKQIVWSVPLNAPEYLEVRELRALLLISTQEAECNSGFGALSKAQEHHQIAVFLYPQKVVCALPEGLSKDDLIYTDHQWNWCFVMIDIHAVILSGSSSSQRVLIPFSLMCEPVPSHIRSQAIHEPGTSCHWGKKKFLQTSVLAPTPMPSLKKAIYLR